MKLVAALQENAASSGYGAWTLTVASLFILCINFSHYCGVKVIDDGLDFGYVLLGADLSLLVEKYVFIGGKICV